MKKSIQFFPDDPPYFELSDTFNSSKKIRIELNFTQRKNVGGRDDLLAKAIGHKKSKVLRVLDGTAGLGRDLSHLLSLGCEVTAIERHEELCQALQMAIPGVEIVCGDTFEFLSSTDSDLSFDVIYLDPMFPEKKKSALPGKESVLLQAFNADLKESLADEKKLLDAARAVAGSRVVIKRPKSAPNYGLIEPSHTIDGKSVRYDVYMSVSLRR